MSLIENQFLRRLFRFRNRPVLVKEVEILRVCSGAKKNNFSRFYQKRVRVRCENDTIIGVVLKVKSTKVKISTEDGIRCPKIAKIYSIVELTQKGKPKPNSKFVNL